MRLSRILQRLSTRAKVVIFGLSAVAIVYYILAQRINKKNYTKDQYGNVLDGTELTEVERDKQSEPYCLDPQKPDPKQNIIYRNKYWQVATSNTSEELVVYSAFYDNREIIGLMPVVRIHGVVRLNRSSIESRVYCQIWLEGFTSPQMSQAEVKITGRDHDALHNKEKRIYGQRLYTCKLYSAGEPYPTHVSLTIAQSCIPATNLIPVRKPSPVTLNWKHEFAVCVESSFGCFKPERLVEWFEAYRMFGVTRFNLYNGSICSELNPVFKYYSYLGRNSSQKLETSNKKNDLSSEKQGTESNGASPAADSSSNRGINDDWIDVENEDAILNFRQLPPSVSQFDEGEFRLSSQVSLNDCYLRHMHNTRFVIIVDYDEIIVPRLHENYKDMIKHIDKTLNMSASYHTYAFRNTYFFEDLPVDNTQPKHLRTLTYRHHVPPSDIFDGCKSFVDTERCLSVFNHYCWLRFPDSPNEPSAIDVDTNIARSHHYRYTCPYKEKKRCESLVNQKKLDDTMIKFKETLRQRVNKVLAELNIKL